MSSDIKILYFASLGERLNCREERFRLEKASLKVAELKEALTARGELWHELLSAPSTRCAVNQTLAKNSVVVKANDEVAFFPPVTGG